MPDRSLYSDNNALTAAEIVAADPGWSARHAIALSFPAPRPSVGRSTIPLGRQDITDMLRFL